jgi:hypothetical protein
MINPAPRTDQGYDSRIKNNSYSSAANVGAKLPLVLQPGTSLLSSESFRPKAKKNDPQLKTIAVLTVLPAAAPAGSFRPPYIGSDKSLRWNKKNLNYKKLRSLPRVSKAPSLESLEQAFERPWIEQKTNWTGRFMHPAENQPAYGRDMAHVLAKGLLSLQLDYSNAEKETLLIRLVQYGIDVYGAAKAGAKWNSDGGHNQGRKMPLLLAATMLNDPKMLDYADAGKHFIFQEDQQTWYVTAEDVGRSLHKDDKRLRVSYIKADIGVAEWGEKHFGNKSRDGRNWNTTYRTVSGSCTVGHVLTARLMGLEKQWNWPPIFDYYDRYWQAEKHRAGHGANAIPAFVAQMWNATRGSAPDNTYTDENVATKVWQNLDIKPQTGSFTFAFDLIASSGKMNGVTGLSSGPAKHYEDLAASIRLAPSGLFDARNGSQFQAANPLKYIGGVKYRVVMSVDVKRKRYSVSVTPADGSRVIIADDWKFRSEQSAVTQLDQLGFQSNQGYHAVLNPGIQPKVSSINQPPRGSAHHFAKKM